MPRILPCLSVLLLVSLTASLPAAADDAQVPEDKNHVGDFNVRKETTPSSKSSIPESGYEFEKQNMKQQRWSSLRQFNGPVGDFDQLKATAKSKRHLRRRSGLPENQAAVARTKRKNEPKRENTRTEQDRDIRKPSQSASTAEGRNAPLRSKLTRPGQSPYKLLASAEITMVIRMTFM